jgi:hypothetical protein
MRHLPLVIAAVLAASCGDSKDWEQEVILQLFRPERAEVGTIIVRVTEGGKTVEKDLTKEISFADCQGNRVRIIPRKDGATYAPVDITVLFGIVGQRREARPENNPVPATSAVVKVWLDTGIINPNLEPKACAPTITPPMRKPLGSACTFDIECEGNICLKDVPNLSGTQVFPKGYCTSKCTKDGDPCDAGRGFCKLYTDAGSPPREYGPYCLRRCKDCTPSACLPCDRIADNYACSTFDLCYPK